MSVKLEALAKLDGVEIVGGNYIRFDGKERVLLARHAEGSTFITPEGETALTETVVDTTTKKVSRKKVTDEVVPTGGTISDSELDKLING